MTPYELGKEAGEKQSLWPLLLASIAAPYLWDAGKSLYKGFKPRMIGAPSAIHQAYKFDPNSQYARFLSPSQSENLRKFDLEQGIARRQFDNLTRAY